MRDEPDAEHPKDRLAADDRRAFALVAAGMALTVAAAYGFGLIVNAPPFARFSFTLSAAALGVAATAPLAFLLFWFMQSQLPSLVKFRESQIEFFSDIGFRFTWSRIAFLAIGAGVTEELLFRGVFQSWLEGTLPLWAAIVAPNLVFGALHARTLLYAIIAAAVGIYLGALLALSDNLLAPIVTHGLYDAAALYCTRRAISARRCKAAPKARDVLP